MTTRVLIPTGALGLGFEPAALARAVAARPDIIAVDGGSTDSGPAYLGTGTSKYSRAATKAEWRALMKARAEAGVPLVIGTAGTCGTDSTVDWMAAITAELAAELGQKLRVARLYCEQPAARVAEAMAAGRVRPLDPAPEVRPADLDAMSHIVALAGAEQIAAALDTGADIVIAGRTTDTATIAALPLRRGEHAGAAWHGAKIGECGSLCTSNPTSGPILIDFDEDGFTVEPGNAEARCTPRSVAAHMLYENADPFLLYEPGGHLDVSHSDYRQLDGRRVRVTGSAWVPGDYTVKLEGARLVGYQSTVLVTLREPRYVRNAEAWVARLDAFLRGEIAGRMGLSEADYALDFRLIGKNATLGALETSRAEPAEVGVMLIVTAPSQERAGEIAKLSNPFLLHYPLTDDEPQATFAFPFSPADWARGPLYEFTLNHVMRLDDPMEAFRLEMGEVG
jgi:hypothetical protein